MNTTCPKCGWSNTRLAVPTGVDRILRIFLLSPVRCRQCRLRFYRFSLRGFEQPAAPPMPAAEVDMPSAAVALPERRPEPIPQPVRLEPSLSSRTSGARRALELVETRSNYELL